MTMLDLQIADAVERLQSGNLIGLPTETVYGLAGDATSAEAVARIYALKGRPSFNPLIAHIASMEMAEREAEFSDTARKLADAFWPGALTLVLPVAPTNSICDLARAGLDTQALRFPAHPIAQQVIKAYGKPLAAPSANKSGQISPTLKRHVEDEFGDALHLILDGGQSVLGIESTVLAVFGDEVTLLRPGSLGREKIEGVIGRKISSSMHDDTAPRSPGMLTRHYAPDARLRLNVTTPQPHEAFLGFGPSEHKVTLNLSEAGDLTEAASNLYAMLRALDTAHDAIAVAPIPETGLGEAINDRLRRAAL